MGPDSGPPQRVASLAGEPVHLDVTPEGLLVGTRSARDVTIHRIGAGGAATRLVSYDAPYDVGVIRDARL